MEESIFLFQITEKAGPWHRPPRTNNTEKRKMFWWLFKIKMNCCAAMAVIWRGKEKTEGGTVQMFVSTRNVIGFCPICSSFVVTVTGHILRGQQHAGWGNGDMISLMIQHDTLVATRAHNPRVDLKWTFSSLPWLSGKDALNPGCMWKSPGDMSNY